MKLPSLLLPALTGIASAIPAAEPVAGPVVGPGTDKILQDRADQATVSLPHATVVGKATDSVETFSGIPYAEPPLGPLRLKPPKRLSRNLGRVDGTGSAPSCPQMHLTTENDNILLDLIGDALTLPFAQAINGQEDCLTVSIQRPAGTKEGDDLPVLFWIYGGAFLTGSTGAYDASAIVKAGVDMGQPLIFVAVNYRVGGFGFMPGKEMLRDGSSNIGLLDQRMGLEWTSDYIRAFGGDPDKVTIWGESAGAISVLDQMVLYGGNSTYHDKKLFRGAIMNSGSVVPADPMDCPKGQEVYNGIVEVAGCTGATDTLECLRALEYTDFLRAANSVPGTLSYHSVALSYLPRPDGVVLPDSPDRLVAESRYAAVPMIIGDQEDEGTLFALTQTNISTTDDIVSYLGSLFFRGASVEDLEGLVGTYPEAVSAGSPFRTGPLNEVRPGFKRLAALLGDVVFTLTRRLFLEMAEAVNPEVPAWSYLASYAYLTPVLGTYHASDIARIFGGGLPNYATESIRTYYINFVTNLDPNRGVEGKYPSWPKWSQGKKLMWFLRNGSDLLDDDFRSESSEFMKETVDKFYI
ncbi:probable triacylglycerol lipase V precursor [Cephalotrichum gorgonifer]|uniref:Carboxylic ester hydrolase n=1 Tax=Cephalotrichum gorgonifer TaxID=2041049 RepID=A0AAE8N2H9_9PEZI|nr:probable triacylglycerol lipase V precursor [Cephalotrichum gorgonifer]